MRNFAKMTEKFRLTWRKFASALTKFRGEISSNFCEIKERKTPNFVCISFAQYCTSIENYFFTVLLIIFWRYREFIFGPTMPCGPCSWSGLIRVFDFLGRPFWKLWSGGVLSKRMPRRNIVRERKEKGFSSLVQNLSGASSLCVSDEVFWTEDLIEETTKRLHDSYTILTLIEHDMPAQLNSSLPNLIPRVLVPYYTCWLSEQRCCQWKCLLPRTSGRIFRF